MTAHTAPQDGIVHADSYVTLHCRLTIKTGPAAGSVFMDSFAQRPATLQMGVGQWAPGLEACLLGRREGQAFSVTLTAEQAYGRRNPELLQWVSHQMLRQHTKPNTDPNTDQQVEQDTPQNTPFSPGDLVTFTAPNGGHYTGVFKQITDDGALFDFNHPLAGADLQLDVQLLGVL